MPVELDQAEQTHRPFFRYLPSILCQYVGMHIKDIQAVLSQNGITPPSLSTFYDVVNGTSKGRPGTEYLQIRDGVLGPAGDLYSDRCFECPIVECDARRRYGGEYQILKEGKEDSDTHYIWLPGISIDSKTTYKKVFEQLGPEVSVENGHTFVDYPSGEYDPIKFENAFEQLIRSLDGKKIRIVATSYGAGEVSRVLSRKPELQKEIESMLLLGPIYKNDGSHKMLRDIRDKLRSGEIDLKFFKRLTLQLGFDNGYLEEGEMVSDFRKKTHKGIHGFAGRARSFFEGRRLTDLIDRTINVPTKIMWFEEDYILASPFQRRAFARKFNNVEIDSSSLKGQHSFNATNAVPIAQAIAAFC